VPGDVTPVDFRTLMRTREVQHQCAEGGCGPGLKRHQEGSVAVLIIAEVGSVHDGSLGTHCLIDAAGKWRDAVKFRRILRRRPSHAHAAYFRASPAEYFKRTGHRRRVVQIKARKLVAFMSSPSEAAGSPKDRHDPLQDPWEGATCRCWRRSPVWGSGLASSGMSTERVGRGGGGAPHHTADPSMHYQYPCRYEQVG
jgi:hypothetical protein